MEKRLHVTLAELLLTNDIDMQLLARLLMANLLEHLGSEKCKTRSNPHCFACDVEMTVPNLMQSLRTSFGRLTLTKKLAIRKTLQAKVNTIVANVKSKRN